MVSAFVNISEKANRTLGVVKALYGLRDKSEAINKVVVEYADKILEPQYNPEYVRKLEAVEKEPRKRVDVDKFFELE